MMQRLGRFLWEVAASLSQMLHLLIGGALYVIVPGKPLPDRDETTSSRVGRAAIAGKRWGLMAESIIDRVAVLLGDEPGHCRRNIGR
jgi:hypothetical protein